MNAEEREEMTGWRGVFQCLPATRNTAQKIIMPLGYFYSPFLPGLQPIKANPSYCAKCRACINSYSQKNKNTKTWSCPFCLTSNPLLLDIGIDEIEEYVEAKVGDNGIFFIVDLCIS